jgi:MOSC domain-containing protein YiiM
VIDLLRTEGHPIAPGTTGENITISGVDWTRIRPGVHILLGNETLLEVTAYTAPCKNIAASFIDGDFTRIAQKRFPGRARLYARVLTPGRVGRGDRVRVIEPA